VPGQAAGADLLVCGVGDVPAQHVVQEDTQGPHSQAGGLVFSLQNPLGRTVHSSSSELLEYSVWLLLVVVFTPRTEVDQLGVEGVQINEDVLVLDVSVEDPRVPAVDHSLNNITKHGAGKMFRERPLLRYKVKKVFAIYFLHDNVIAMSVINVVQDPDHPGNVLHLLHQYDFCWNVRLTFIIILITNVFQNFFNCNLKSVTDPDGTEHSSKASLSEHLLQFIL